MSASVERLFSLSKRRDSEYRPQFAVETLEMLLCVWNWNANGLISPAIIKEEQIILDAAVNIPAENEEIQDSENAIDKKELEKTENYWTFG
jgi:hypothetical protein